MAGRFSYSTPERGHSTPWFKVGEIGVTTTVLVAVLCVFSFVIEAIDASLLEPFVLVADDVRRGELWRLVTWPLVNKLRTGPGFWAIITIALFWYFGKEVEGMLGRNRFVWFLLILTVVPGIVAAVVDFNVNSIRHIETAILLVFIAEFPFARFFFNIPGWVIGVVIVSMDLLILVGDRDGSGIIFLFVLIATAALAARSFGLATQLPWIPKLPLPDALSGTSSSGPRRSRKGKVRGRKQQAGTPVVEGPWKAPPPPPRTPSPDAAAAQRELDVLLDKISSGGLESLTAEEKKRLNELSKRLR